jgi:signal transduction histidine kinase
MKRSRLFALCMLLVICSISLLPSVLSAQAAASRSESADANVNRNDLRLVSLQGEWQFYWKQALSPDDFNSTAITSTNPPKGATIKVPSSWAGQKLGQSINNGKPLPRFGYATYHKQLTIEPRQVGTNMALLLESVGSAYRVWVNGELLDGLGNVATNQESETPWIRLNLVYLSPQTQQLDIVIQTSNYSFRESGIFGDSKIGDANALTLYVFKKYVLKDLLFIGAFLVIGLYHLIIYFISKRTADLLWLGAISIFVAIRALLLNKFLFYSVFSDLSWTIVMHAQFAFKFIALLTYLGLIRSLYRDDVNPLLHRVLTVIGFFMLLYVLVVPPSHFTVTFLAQTIVMVITLVYYGIFVGYLALRNRREGASLNMVGSIVFIFGVVHDYFLFTTNLSSVQMIPFVLLVYLLLQAGTISYRYAMIQRRNLQLAGALQEMNQNLETMVVERTEELNQSNAKLVAFDEQRTKLLENIAHDLGSPLAGMQTQVYLLGKGDAGPKQLKTIAQQMKQGVDYMKRQVQDLFDLTKMSRDDEVNIGELLSVRQLCDSMTQFLQEQVGRGQILLKLRDAIEMQPEHTGSTEPMVLADTVSIIRVVQNYVENAIKFSSMFPCPIEVTYDIRGTSFVFEISDFGKGISPDELPHVFERFYKGAGNRKGIGLGLAIAKELMEAYGGEIGVHSVLGEGSTFWFKLPLVSSDVEPQGIM